MVDLDRVVFDCPSLIFTIGNKIFAKTHEDSELNYLEINESVAMNYFNSLFFLKMSHAKNFHPVGNSVEVLKKWFDQGFDIYFVSSRPKFKAFQKATVEWLRNHGINYHKLIFSCSNKARFCALHDIDLMVDDTFENCDNSAKLGIPAVWVKTKYNQNETHSVRGKVYNTDSWNKIDMYAQGIYKNKYLLSRGEEMNKKTYLVGDIESKMKELYGEDCSVSAELPILASKYNDTILETGEPDQMTLTFNFKSKKGIFSGKGKKVEVKKKYSMIESLQDGTPIIKNIDKVSSDKALLDRLVIKPSKVGKLFISEDELTFGIIQSTAFRKVMEALTPKAPIK